jgi:hypothetical protein
MIILEYCTTVANLEFRNRAWQYEYIALSRRMGELWEQFSAIVKNSGGFVHARDGCSAIIEIPEDRVWRLRALRLSYVGRTSGRVFYNVDLRPVRLCLVG